MASKAPCSEGLGQSISQKWRATTQRSASLWRHVCDKMLHRGILLYLFCNSLHICPERGGGLFPLAFGIHYALLARKLNRLLTRGKKRHEEYASFGDGLCRSLPDLVQRCGTI